MPGHSNPTPHGAALSVAFAGAVRLLLLETTLFWKIVQCWMFVEANVGSGEVFCPESHAPSWGGGVSSSVNELGPIPMLLLRKIEFCTIRLPPALVPE